MSRLSRDNRGCCIESGCYYGDMYKVSFKSLHKEINSEQRSLESEMPLGSLISLHSGPDLFHLCFI